jgi:hypothetical protein
MSRLERAALLATILAVLLLGTAIVYSTWIEDREKKACLARGGSSFENGTCYYTVGVPLALGG